MEIYYSINNPFIISYKFIGLNWISCPFFDNSYIELIAHCPLPYSLRKEPRQTTLTTDFCSRQQTVARGGGTY